MRFWKGLGFLVGNVLFGMGGKIQRFMTKNTQFPPFFSSPFQNIKKE
jgi:hypothetical protein